MGIATLPGECDAGGAELHLLTALGVGGEGERGCCLPVLPTYVLDSRGPGSGGGGLLPRSPGHRSRLCPV